MADEVTGQAAQTAGEAGSSAQAAETGQTATAATNAGSGERTFTQADLDRVVEERLAKERKRQEKAAEEKRLSEEGRFKELLEAKERELQEKDAELQRVALAALKSRVGTKHGLPAELVDRLQGGTEAELEKDAEGLAKLLGDRTPPPNFLAPNGARNPANAAESASDKLKIDAALDKFPSLRNRRIVG